MRERAADANLVIVNHHLLCADASVRQGDFGEVIPECDLLVIDEAHQLEDVVTQYFGIALGTHRVDQFARDSTPALSTLSLTDRPARHWAHGGHRTPAAMRPADVRAAARRRRRPGCGRPVETHPRRWPAALTSRARLVADALTIGSRCSVPRTPPRKT